MSRYGYHPGGAPDISPAQKQKNDAVFAWQRGRDRLAGQMIDLLLAGRLDEARQFQDVIDTHRAAEPSYW